MTGAKFYNSQHLSDIEKNISDIPSKKIMNKLLSCDYSPL